MNELGASKPGAGRGWQGEGCKARETLIVRRKEFSLKFCQRFKDGR